MNKIFKKWNLNKNIKLSLLSLASGFILLTFYLKYKKEQRIIREKLIKYNPLLNPSRKILKINREKMIDILEAFVPEHLIFHAFQKFDFL